MRARMLGAHGRVVQNGIGEAHMFLLTRAPWVEPIELGYPAQELLTFASCNQGGYLEL